MRYLRGKKGHLMMSLSLRVSEVFPHFELRILNFHWPSHWTRFGIDVLATLFSLILTVLWIYVLLFNAEKLRNRYCWVICPAIRRC